MTVIPFRRSESPSVKELVEIAAEGAALADRLIGDGELRAALMALDTAREVLRHALSLQRA